MAKRSGLGRGLDRLIDSADLKSQNLDETPDASEKEKSEKQEKMIKLRMIEPNHSQPREKFDEDTLSELADSIKAFGIIQPLIVQKKGEYYEIVAGERRWRAAKIAGLKEVPVIVKEFTEREVAEISLVENLQREDLNPIEEARAFQKLIAEYQLKQEEIAEKLGKSRSVITNALRLLKLTEKVQTMLIEGLLSTGHAKAILALNDEKMELIAAEKIIDEQLSVRETEKLVKELLNPKETKEKPVLANEVLYQTIEERIKNKVGSMVKIRRKDENKGKIEIEYYSNEDLERIIEAMGIYEEESGGKR